MKKYLADAIAEAVTDDYDELVEQLAARDRKQRLQNMRERDNRLAPTAS